MLTDLETERCAVKILSEDGGCMLGYQLNAVLAIHQSPNFTMSDSDTDKFYERGAFWWTHSTILEWTRALCRRHSTEHFILIQKWMLRLCSNQLKKHPLLHLPSRLIKYSELSQNAATIFAPSHHHHCAPLSKNYLARAVRMRVLVLDKKGYSYGSC